MGVQDAKKKDSKPQPTENDLLRAAMVGTHMPQSPLQSNAVGPPSSLAWPSKMGHRISMQYLSKQPCLQTGVMERKLFIIPSFKIYGGVAGFFDFGPPGCAVKQNITQLWRQHFILEENMLEVWVPLMHDACSMRMTALYKPPHVWMSRCYKRHQSRHLSRKPSDMAACIFAVV